MDPEKQATFVVIGALRVNEMLSLSANIRYFYGKRTVLVC